MISRKDYELITDTINRRLMANGNFALSEEGKSAVTSVAMDLGYAFQQQNSRFNLEQYVTAFTKQTTISSHLLEVN
jgi:hypothetical protein